MPKPNRQDLAISCVNQAVAMAPWEQHQKQLEAEASALMCIDFKTLYLTIGDCLSVLFQRRIADDSSSLGRGFLLVLRLCILVDS